MAEWIEGRHRPESGQLLDVAFEIYEGFIPRIEGGGALEHVLSHEGRFQVALYS